MIGEGQVHALGRCGWELARSALGARRGYREFAGMTQGSSSEEDRDSLKDYRGTNYDSAIELQQDDGPRSSLGIEPASDNAMGSRQSSLGDSPKGSGSSLGARREITGRRLDDLPQECRRLPN
ncbi:hypothetical protein B296_00049206 [Ensete ventricosum]|uniref:Uncharacterized protein n=1 Tax=Ensete ventricosum TaxID=4639 RepID=A0A426X0C3_ENSVE|nr:hypothetical protein B296_00049206 [Ensete ventricosum]